MNLILKEKYLNFNELFYLKLKDKLKRHLQYLVH